MSASKRLLYLPGIDGTLGAGERLFEHLPEFQALQPNYPASIAKDLHAATDWILQEYFQEGQDVDCLIGESYGSALAQVLLERRTNIAKNVIMLAGFTALPRPKLARVTSSLLRILPGWSVKWPLRLLARVLLLQATSEEERQRFYEMLAELPLREIAARIESLRPFDGRALAERASPCLWIWGEGDTLMNHAAERRWLRTTRPLEKTIVIAEAGHVLIRSQPETLALHVRAFLKLKPLSNESSLPPIA